MANSIKAMREATYNGVIDQNGNNKDFYRSYETDGKIAGSKEGIVTIPTELTPRQAHVDKSATIEKDFAPKFDAEKAAEREPVQAQEWRTHATVKDTKTALGTNE